MNKIYKARLYRPALQVPVVTEVKAPEVVENELVKHNKFQQDYYIKFLTRFINERCEYDYMRLTHVDDIKAAYNKFLYENKDEARKYNVNLALSIFDIPKLDNRFQTKNLTCCKSCRSKHYKNCCPEYAYDHRTKLSYILNLKLV